MSVTFPKLKEITEKQNKYQCLFILGWLFAFWRWDIINICSQLLHIDEMILMLFFWAFVFSFELLAIIKNKKIKIEIGFILIMFMIFCFIQSLMLNPNSSGMSLFGDFTKYVILIVFFAMQIEDRDMAIDYFGYSSIIALVIFAPWPFTKSISYYNDIAYYGTGMVYGENVIVPCFIGIYTLYKRKKRIILFALSIIVVLMGIAVANRGALLACTSYFFLYNLMITKNDKKKTIILSSVAMFSSLIVINYKIILSFAQKSLEKMKINSYTINKFVVMSQNESNMDAVTSGRDRTYSTAIRLFNEHPFGGIGFGTFSEIGNDAFVHNVFLDWYVSLGAILGTVFFIATLFIVIKFVLVKNKNDKCFFLILLSLWFPKLIFSKTFVNDIGYWLFMVCV